MPKLRILDSIFRWPVLRQLERRDFTALGDTASSSRSKSLRPRTEKADQVVGSVCPYCARGGPARWAMR